MRSCSCLILFRVSSISRRESLDSFKVYSFLTVYLNPTLVSRQSDAICSNLVNQTNAFHCFIHLALRCLQVMYTKIQRFYFIRMEMMFKFQMSS